MEHFSELIQARTEPLGNKQIILEHFNLRGAVFILI